VASKKHFPEPPRPWSQSRTLAPAATAWPRSAVEAALVFAASGAGRRLHPRTQTVDHAGVRADEARRRRDVIIDSSVLPFGGAGDCERSDRRPGVLYRYSLRD